MLPFPTVAEEPISQYTLHPLPALPPRLTATLEFLAVVRVVLIWKIHCALGLPCASSFRAPVIERLMRSSTLPE